MEKATYIEESWFINQRYYINLNVTNQVLVMGANEEEEAYFMKRLEADDVKMLPKKVTTEYSIPERQKLYLDGGVLFITTRILVVDMLTDRMPMCKLKSKVVSIVRSES